MSAALKILKRDLARILKNPLAIIVTIGVAVIPCLYAWFNILANWDPYTNTSEVKVAVVNLDKGSEVPNMGQINAGDMIVENMKQNTQLSWTFVDKDTAKTGVADGTFYAAYIIPADFTKNLADVMEGNADPATIDYLLNEKLNPIAPKVTDTAASTLESEIAANFSKVVSETITEKITAATKKVKGAIDGGIGSVTESLDTLNSSLDAANGDLEHVATSLDTTKDALKQSSDSLLQLKDVAKNGGTKLQDTLNLLPGARDDARSFENSLTTKLYQGLGTLTTATSTANTTVSKLSGTAEAAAAKLDSMISVLQGARDETQSIYDRIDRIRATIQDSTILPSGVKDDISSSLSEELSRLESFIEEQDTKISELNSISQHIKDGATSAEDLAGAIDTAAKTTQSTTEDVLSSYTSNVSPALDSVLDGISQNGASLAADATNLSDMFEEASKEILQLGSILDTAKSSVLETKDIISSIQESLQSAKTDLGLIATSDGYKDLDSLISLKSQDIANFALNPTNIIEEAIYPVKNYGSGIAPFFTNVALWVGGIALIVIYKMEVDLEGLDRGLRPWQSYLGRLLLLLCIGQLQALVVSIGNLIIGIQCEHPLAYIFATMFASFCFINIIYALTIAFKHIGRALAFLILILQVPGSSGMYPIEMMPGFFQAINPWLPFTYSNNAMREAIAGFYGSYYLNNLLILFLFVPPALLIGAALRRHLININELFDSQLRESDLFVSEPASAKNAHFKLSTLIKATLNSKEYQEIFLARAARFELLYPKLIHIGYFLIAIVPILLLLLLMILPMKFLMLVLWAISLVLVATYLIVVEYLHARVIQKSGLKDLPADTLYQLLQESLSGELFAFAPYKKLIEKAGGHDRLADAISRMKENN